MAHAAARFRNDLIGDLTMDATSNTKTATLTVGNKTYDFPILSGTVGPDVIDIAKLYALSGMFTYDPGFTSTGSWNGPSPCCCVSKSCGQRRPGADPFGKMRNRYEPAPIDAQEVIGTSKNLRMSRR